MNFADDNLCDPNFTLTMNAASYSCISGTTAQINTTQQKGSDFPTYNAKIAITPSFTIKFAAPAGSDSPAGVAGFFYDQFTDNNFYYGGLIVHYYWTDTNGTTEFLNVGFCKAATSGQTGYNDPLTAFKKRYDLDAYYAISNTAVPAGGSSTTTVDFSFQADSNLYGYVTTRGSAGQITAKFEFVRFSYYDGATYTIPAGSVLKVTRSASTTTPASFTLYSKQTDAQVTYYKTFYRSGDQFTLNDICNLTFDNILDYCKRFRIFIFVDEANKKLIFQRASKYFSTNAAFYAQTIDRSTQFDIEPVTFDKHYLTFGYSEPNSLLGESYKNMYASYPYGAK